ncbi:hypothetical protein V6N12_062560 [Hibiscus sabdariffa]|uniref:Uncharacterized protein n=1 Tax=Hibiscus sabdariffa TaxID=183260 RepID=A0ABR2F981_9ROSI
MHTECPATSFPPPPAMKSEPAECASCRSQILLQAPLTVLNGLDLATSLKGSSVKSDPGVLVFNIFIF